MDDLNLIAQVNSLVKLRFHLEQAKKLAESEFIEEYNPVLFADMFASIDHDITIAHGIDLILSIVYHASKTEEL